MVNQAFGETDPVGSKHGPQLFPYLDYGSTFLSQDSRNTKVSHRQP
jgi:hypothetical protein